MAIDSLLLVLLDGRIVHVLLNALPANGCVGQSDGDVDTYTNTIIVII